MNKSCTNIARGALVQGDGKSDLQEMISESWLNIYPIWTISMKQQQQQLISPQRGGETLVV